MYEEKCAEVVAHNCFRCVFHIMCVIADWMAMNHVGLQKSQVSTLSGLQSLHCDSHTHGHTDVSPCIRRNGVSCGVSICIAKKL